MSPRKCARCEPYKSVKTQFQPRSIFACWHGSVSFPEAYRMARCLTAVLPNQTEFAQSAHQLNVPLRSERVVFSVFKASIFAALFSFSIRNQNSAREPVENPWKRDRRSSSAESPSCRSGTWQKRILLAPIMTPCPSQWFGNRCAFPNTAH